MQAQVSGDKRVGSQPRTAQQYRSHERAGVASEENFSPKRSASLDGFFLFFSLTRGPGSADQCPAFGSNRMTVNKMLNETHKKKNRSGHELGKPQRHVLSILPTQRQHPESVGSNTEQTEKSSQASVATRCGRGRESTERLEDDRGRSQGA